ncbi:hypothetical protein BASA60_007500 [Batrachochytrium salamandrivorans]|nr:hypothetical protein BASA60_007500 [Batrachochytrium salamandrivorans]
MSNFETFVDTVTREVSLLESIMGHVAIESSSGHSRRVSEDALMAPPPIPPHPASRSRSSAQADISRSGVLHEQGSDLRSSSRIISPSSLSRDSTHAFNMDSNTSCRGTFISARRSISRTASLTSQLPLYAFGSSADGIDTHASRTRLVSGASTAETLQMHQNTTVGDLKAPVGSTYVTGVLSPDDSAPSVGRSRGIHSIASGILETPTLTQTQPLHVAALVESGGRDAPFSPTPSLEMDVLNTSSWQTAQFDALISGSALLLEESSLLLGRLHESSRRADSSDMCDRIEMANHGQSSDSWDMDNRDDVDLAAGRSGMSGSDISYLSNGSWPDLTDAIDEEGRYPSASLLWTADGSLNLSQAEYSLFTRDIDSLGLDDDGLGDGEPSLNIHMPAVDAIDTNDSDDGGEYPDDEDTGEYHERYHTTGTGSADSSSVIDDPTLSSHMGRSYIRSFYTDCDTSADVALDDTLLS